MAGRKALLMSDSEIIAAFEKLLPRHDGGLTISHNEPQGNYESVGEYLSKSDIDFADDESRAKCIESNSLWEIHVYPNTPIGSYNIGASTLLEAVMLARKCLESEWVIDNTETTK